jgi:hypothetical protein
MNTAFVFLATVILGMVAGTAMLCRSIRRGECEEPEARRAFDLNRLTKWR